MNLFHSCWALVSADHVLYCVVRYWLFKIAPF